MSATASVAIVTDITKGGGSMSSNVVAVIVTATVAVVVAVVVIVVFVGARSITNVIHVAMWSTWPETASAQLRFAGVSLGSLPLLR